MNYRIALIVLLGLVRVSAFASAAAGHSDRQDTLIIAIGAAAPQTERFAAEELQRYLRAIFAAHVDIVPAGSGGAKPEFLVGTVDGNPEIRKIYDRHPWSLAEQAILLRKVSGSDGTIFVISGGSAPAVLWGVYELMERYGVRYLLHGDVLPKAGRPFYLPDVDEVLAPNLSTRCWRLVNADAMGPESWGLQETDSFVDQLAKMKFNRIFLSFWPWQSYSDFEFRGVKKRTGISFFGFHFPVSPDMPGYGLFRGMTEFENPEFIGAKTYEQRRAAAQRLARGVLEHGRRRGMEVGIAIQPLDFPKEFQPTLPGSRAVKQLGNLTVGPGPGQSSEDPVLADLVATVITSYLRDYPETEWLHVQMPEHRGWTGEAEKAWDALNRKYQLDAKVTVAELRQQARRRTTYATGDRAEHELEGDIAALYFFDRVIREQHLLQRPGQSDVRLVYVGVSEELLPFLPKLLPPHGEILTFVDYTASEVARQVPVLQRIPARRMPTSLIYTLADDNIGVLPQVATGSFDSLNRVLRANGWRGYYTRYWMIGELDPTVHYLARASWNSRITPDMAYRDLLAPICGPSAVAPFTEALHILEAVTTRINQESDSLAFPVANMLLKHYNEEKWRASPIPEQFRQDAAMYQHALACVRRAREVSNPSGYAFLDYYLGRLVFTAHYFQAVESMRRAGTAQQSDRTASAVRLLDEALRDIRAGVEAYAQVARDNSDRGTIATLDEYAYRAVRNLRQQLAAEQPHSLAIPAP